MITKEMNPLEIVQKYPETEEVFHEYDDVLGKCLLCYFLFDPLEETAFKNNLDLEEMVEKLNTAADSGNNSKSRSFPE